MQVGVNYSLPHQHGESMNEPLPEHYGELEVAVITDKRVFFCLLDEMCKESETNIHGVNRVFYHTRVSMLDAFMQGRLFGMSVSETDTMFQRSSMQDDLFMLEGFYHIPCFCITARHATDTAEMMWTAPRARNKGLEMFFKDILGVKTSSMVLQRQS
jgi:hypothetical protein